MTIDTHKLRQIVEAALLAAGRPLDVNQLLALFGDEERSPTRDEILAALQAIGDSLDGRGYQLKQVASGWRFQVREEFGLWVGRLWSEKPQKYSRALLETLSIVAYRQPITRGEIEEIRGVAVSTGIVRTLMERDWVRVVGHREVPGRPALYATTRAFLDYFNVKSLDELPTLAEVRDLASIAPELDFEPSPDAAGAEPVAVDDESEHPDGELAPGEGDDREHRPSNVIDLPTS